MRLTVGPLPAAVYWRRRALVLGAALLAVFLIAQACLGASAEPGGGPSADGSPDSEQTHGIGGLIDYTPPAQLPDPSGDVAQVDSQDAGPAPTDGGTHDAEMCSDSEMRVTAEARGPDGAAVTSFAAGDPVELWIIIGNGADRECVRNIGGDHRELYLIQGTGASRIWTSRDCAPPQGNDERLLPPGFETSHYLVWNGRASDRCDDEDQPGGERVEPGGYQLYARLGGAVSDPVDLTID